MDEVLARSGIFQGVDHDAAEALAKEMETIDARKGEVVFSEGEPGDSLYIVLSGKIKVGRRAADGRQNLIAVMGPSDMVGERIVGPPQPPGEHPQQLLGDLGPVGQPRAQSGLAQPGQAQIGDGRGGRCARAGVEQ